MNYINTLMLSHYPIILLAMEEFFNKINSISIQPEYSLKLKCECYNEAIKEDIKNKINKYEILIIDDDGVSKKGIEKIKNFLINEDRNWKGILFTSQDNKLYLESFILLGIEGILSKKETLDDFKNAIIKIFNGKKYYDDIIKNFLLNDKIDSKEDNAIDNLITNKIELKQKEKEIIQLISQGYQNKEIADKMYLSPKTIETYKSKLVEMFNLRSTKELNQFCIKYFRE